MNRYTLYCTPEQTKRALELGAPIIKEKVGKCITEGLARLGCIDEENEYDCLIPTAEQMINWLEEQVGIVVIEITEDAEFCSWEYEVWHIKSPCSHASNFNSRKEATLAAIDASLEYLINNKK